MAKSAAAVRGYIAKEANSTPSLESVTTAIANLQKGYDDFKKENDAKLEVIAKTGKLDPLVEEKVNKASDAVGALQKQLDEITKQLNRPQLGADGKPVDPEREAHRKHFGAYFRKGIESEELKAIEQKTFSIGSNADGGYTAPQEVDRQVAAILKEVSPMRQVARVITTGAPSYRKIVNAKGMASGWVGESAARTPGNTPTLQNIDIVPGEVYAQPEATQQFLDDTFLNAEEWIAAEVAEEFAYQENAAFISGNGTNRPKGFLAETMAADSARTLLQIGYVPTGVSAAFAASNPADQIIQLVYSQKAAYRGRSSWMANRNTLRVIRQFKDSTGQYLWQPSLQAGQPETLAGYQARECPDMPDIAANSFSLAFGDWQSAYYIVDRVGIRTIRDPYTNKPFVRFYTTKRVGGATVLHEAIKLLKFGVS